MKTGNTYKTYKEYLDHQATKAKTPKWRSKLLEERQERLNWFRSQFSSIIEKLPKGMDKVLCLGARFGEEVVAWNKLGIAAIGLDIEAYLPHVVVGDMNDLRGYHNLDMIYTNAIDHCWSIDAFIYSMKGALKPGGYLVMHAAFGVGEYETCVPETPAEVRELFEKHFDVLYDKVVEDQSWTLAHLFIFQKGL